MAFNPVAKLSDLLTGGYHLNARLQALLGCPLDSRGQEEAIAFSEELSRVFMVSMSMLKPDDSKRTLNKMAPVIRTGDSFGICTLAKDKVIVSREGEGGTSRKNIRGQEFTRKEITSSPHVKDGYKWRKYGQKNIQNCRFARYYYSCKRDRDCPAKKKVQQQDGSSEDAPVFEVTYVNDHTCHHAVAHGNDEGSCGQKSLPAAATTTTGQQPSCFKAPANPSSALFDRIGAEENEAIVACLATVISGTAPSSSPPAPGTTTSPSDDPLASYAPQQLAGVQPPSAYDGSMVAGGAMPMMDTGFWWWDHPSSPFCPAEVIMDLRDEDVHVGAARFVDGTARPQYFFLFIKSGKMTRAGGENRKKGSDPGYIKVTP